VRAILPTVCLDGGTRRRKRQVKLLHFVMQSFAFHPGASGASPFNFSEYMSRPISAVALTHRIQSHECTIAVLRQHSKLVHSIDVGARSAVALLVMV
jgi:hypothetical protein